MTLVLSWSSRGGGKGLVEGGNVSQLLLRVLEAAQQVHQKMYHCRRGGVVVRMMMRVVTVVIMLVVTLLLVSWFDPLSSSSPSDAAFHLHHEDLQEALKTSQKKVRRGKKIDNNNQHPDNHNNHPLDNHNKDPLLLPTQGYTVPNCPCVRFGLDKNALNSAREAAATTPWLYPSWFIKNYTFKGESTCSDYSTQRGGGQRVVSFSYYSVDPVTDYDSEHSKKYFRPLYGRALAIATLYPGWLMRIYHNVSSQDHNATKYLCSIYCAHSHVDLCPVTELPDLGNLIQQVVVGRLWRFAEGDPTVEAFMSRDTDSWILERETVVVQEWLKSGKAFHVIRDHPSHKAIILAGLWGGFNIWPNTLRRVRGDIFHHPANYSLKYDQYMLATRVWPVIKNDVLQHDSYNCLREGHTGARPFPVKREDFQYCGWGPFKYIERRRLSLTKCPPECRPQNHSDWNYC
ncbi:uncharacterized protein LOC121870734 [Homarus americanus]|uniref:uncharacterized protein LOC121870734 n=1 Tax=Homarus americanus TaxID=6706 RepID=UPI001C469FE3|nr:uncharacterized protein LOC121870734 [Homarus americanus]